jgi:hypothetical protein
MTKDRIVFDKGETVRVPRFLRWVGPLYLLFTVALWVFIGELLWQVVLFVILGCMFTAQAYPRLLPKTDRWDTYVDREKVGWTRPPLRRQTVSLADITEVRSDTEDPRWASKVVLTLEDGTSREIVTASPIELIEVLEIRRVEARGRAGS